MANTVTAKTASRGQQCRGLHAGKRAANLLGLGVDVCLEGRRWFEDYHTAR
jgi:hypothetical protein